MGIKKRINITFSYDKEEFEYVELYCNFKKISVQEFLENLVLDFIDDFEDEQDIKKYEKILENSKEEDRVSWEEAIKLAEWEV